MILSSKPVIHLANCYGVKTRLNILWVMSLCSATVCDYYLSSWQWPRLYIVSVCYFYQELKLMFKAGLCRVDGSILS